MCVYIRNCQRRINLIFFSDFLNVKSPFRVGHSQIFLPLISFLPINPKQTLIQPLYFQQNTNIYS